MKGILLTLGALSILLSCVAEQAPTNYTGLVKIKDSKSIHFSLEEDSTTPVKIVIEEDDSNVDLRLNLLESPKNGELIGCDKQDKELNCLYIPYPNFNGKDEIIFNSNDGSFKSKKAFVKISVEPMPDAPVLNSNTLYFSTHTNRTIRFTLPRATDIDGDELKYELTQGNDSNNLYCYTKNSLYFCEYNSQDIGIENFSYRAYDQTKLYSAEVDFVITTESIKCGNLSEGTSQTKTFYKASQVPHGFSCEQEDRVRTCQNGRLSSWSGSYIYESCTVQRPRSCGNMNHGETELRTRYLRSTEAYGKTCQNELQQRKCNNGTLSDWSGSYTSTSCNVEGARNCGHLVHGASESRARYKDLEVSPGETCHSEVQKRSCSEGNLSSWTGSYTNLSCNVRQFKSCGSVGHGSSKTRIMYKKSSVEYTESCESQLQYQTCKDGQMDNWSGTYTQTSCFVKEALSCGDLAHEEEIVRRKYQRSIVEPDETCQSERQVKRCINGALESWTGSYTNNTCEIRGYNNCGSVVHSQAQTRTRYQKSSVSLGETCQKETQAQQCLDGKLSVWSGSYTFTSCRTPGQKTDTFTAYKNTKPAVDLVWVIDNSASMGDDQSKLASSFNSFISHFLEKGIDFKMAITHSDISIAPSNQVNIRDSLQFLTSVKAKENESKFINDFKRIIKVGTHGSGYEKMFSGAIRFANEYSTFFRPNAHTVLIMVTDEVEQSGYSAESVINSLTKNKSNEGLLKSYVFYGDHKGYDTYMGPDQKMIELADRTNGHASLLRTTNLSNKLYEIGKEVSTLVSGYSLSERPESQSNITVKVNGVIDSRWIYDLSSNSIKLTSPKFTREENTVEIIYKTSSQTQVAKVDGNLAILYRAPASAILDSSTIIQHFAESLESNSGDMIMEALKK